MKVLGHFHKYAPEHNAGAELYAHTLMRDLARRGHQVQVVVSGIGRPYSHDGIPVRYDGEKRGYAWCDVAVTHLDVTRRAVLMAREARRPLVHLLHNHLQLKHHRVRPPDAALVVYNSRWLSRAVRWRGATAVVRPVVNPDEYWVERGGDALTLINLFSTKGAATFWELAERMPGRSFIGVRGAYGTQVERDLPNVEVLDNTPAIRDVYARTRILLMPSAYESWGRTAMEAAASGIPTIAAPTAGLVESLGHAATFANADDVDAWEDEIRRLDDPAWYAEQSLRAAARARSFDFEAELDAFEAALEGVAR